MKIALTLCLTLCSILTYAQYKAKVDSTAETSPSVEHPQQLHFLLFNHLGGVPLYVVDGSVVTVEEFDRMDRHKIESISVVRDTAATKTYGYKGRNGIVLIQMKKKDSFQKEN